VDQELEPPGGVPGVVAEVGATRGPEQKTEPEDEPLNDAEPFLAQFSQISSPRSALPDQLSHRPILPRRSEGRGADAGLSRPA